MDSPSAEEKRAGVPAGYVGHDAVASDRWITGQVFIDKKKNQRIYFALQDSNWYSDKSGGSCLVSIHGGRYYDDKRSRRDDDWKFWQIGAYRSVAGEERTYSRDIVSESTDLHALLEELYRIEKKTREEGYVPVPGLSGNYRDVAAAHGWYFDDKGVLHDTQKTVITTGAALSRRQLGKLYADAAQKKEPVVIRTWEDYYRGIADKVDISAFGDHSEIQDWFVKCSREVLQSMDNLDRCIADETRPLRERELAVNYVKCHGARYEADAGLDYQYFVMRLTSLVRAGQKVYAALMAAPTTEGHLHMLEYVRESILHMHSERQGITPEMAAQIANLVTQGADPRDGMPYPLQALLDRRPASPPNPKPSAP